MLAIFGAAASKTRRGSFVRRDSVEPRDLSLSDGSTESRPTSKTPQVTAATWGESYVEQRLSSGRSAADIRWS
jgi:hypothetical protein